jgi:hypothetical protein
MKRLYLGGILILFMIASGAATPVRIIGMGTIDLVIEDESNRINLYDFGGNVAGLYSDERGSSAEGFISYGHVSSSDSNGPREPEVTRWGGFLPMDGGISVNTFTAFGGVPAGGLFTYRSPQGYAAVAKAMYSSTSSHYENLDRTDDATAPLFGIAFSRNFGTFDAGATGEYSGLTITNGRDDSEINASMKTLNGGFAAELSPLFTVGISGGLGFPAADLAISSTDFDLSGNSFSGGIQAIAKVPGLAKLGARLGFLNANLGAEASSGNVTLDLGELDFTDVDFEARALVGSMLFPLRAGAIFSYETFHPEFEGDITSLLDIDMRITTMDFGIGLGYVLPLITPGFQYNLSNEHAADDLNDNEVDASGWDLRFGGESRFGFLTLRGGFGIGKKDPDTDTDDDEMKKRSLSFGTTFSMPMQPYRIEFAYVNTETKPEDNPEEQKEVDDSISLALKLRF